jgi:hypothetical protein
MNICVPVMINDIPVDAANAPIAFSIGVGGYMSVNNAGTGEEPRAGARMGDNALFEWTSLFDVSIFNPELSFIIVLIAPGKTRVSR